VRVFTDLDTFDAGTARDELAATGLFDAVALPFTLSTFVLPNDSMLSSQWHVTSSSAGISLPSAWNEEKGSASTVIAILDTGVDVGHPDLSGNMWNNSGEIANNGVDDDGNGWVDDVWGWDAGDNDKDPSPVPYYEGGVDVGFHGTHCAGIASATTNNSTGIAGAGWRCSIMGVKMVQTDVGMTDVAITNAFLYCAETKPDVISMSFGGPDQGGMAAFMQQLINTATAEGIVCVAAAGNNGDNARMYPAACSGVISVGATNESNQRASFSSYGNWVDIAAPGEHIWSTIQSNYSWDFLTGILFMLMYGWDGLNPYMYCDGTSMACPLVAGVCGLVKSAAPGMTSDEMAAHLKDTGDVVNYDQNIGKRVNAYNAVTNLSTGAPMVAATTFRVDGGAPNPFASQTSVRFTLDAPGDIRLGVFDVAGRFVRTLVDGPLTAGSHARTWDGTDATGRSASAGVYFARLEFGGRQESTRLVLLR
jgi:subtilisin family serine protease